MHGGAEVMMKSGQREFERARASAGLRFGFKDLNL
jgi:hypothetical protein